ncbi:MAG: DUF4389 domain-containing protein [Acidimicrobiia bacterium]
MATTQTKSSAPAGRVVALVAGVILALPSLGALLGGAALGIAYVAGRDDDGWFTADLERVASPTPAITAEEVDISAEPGRPRRLVRLLDADVRLRVTDVRSEGEIFVGVAREDDLDRYLDGIAHDEVTDVDDGDPEYRARAGADMASPPDRETFWVEKATGPGTQELVWEVESGEWAVAVLNADGSPGVSVDVEVGAKAGFLFPLVLILLAAGAVGLLAGVALIVFGADGLGRGGVQPAAGTVLPGPAGMATAGSGALPEETAPPAEPVTLEARLDPDLSRWKWLVKWFLAIPHLVVLVLLWIAFVFLTVVAGVAILFTGRYPRGIFDFNVGVLRWTWRVSYYAWSGGLGTDRYPPFSLRTGDDEPATLEIAYPARLSRPLVLVKWWLLAIPHYVIVGLLLGDAGGLGDRAGSGPGLTGVLVVVAGVILLFRGRYPRSIFDLVVGLNRWIVRVVAYAALLTDRYPPFRLDQGGAEPAG